MRGQRIVSSLRVMWSLSRRASCSRAAASDLASRLEADVRHASMSVLTWSMTRWSRACSPTARRTTAPASPGSGGQDQAQASFFKAAAGQRLHDGPRLVEREDVGRGDDDQLIKMLQVAPVLGIELTTEIGENPGIVPGKEAEQSVGAPGLGGSSFVRFRRAAR